MWYEAQFYGRLQFALGICYSITDKVEGDNPEQARINLYKKYEKVHQLKLREIDMGMPKYSEGNTGLFQGGPMVDLTTEQKEALNEVLAEELSDEKEVA